MTYIKICGLRTIEHALAAVEAGADMLGFVFAPSRRQVTPKHAAEIVRAVRQTGRRTTLMGLFVNAAPERVVMQAGVLELDQIQLSGDEDVSILGQLGGRPIVKAVRLHGGTHEQGWLDLPPHAVRLLVDAHVDGSYGGAGVVGDWTKAATLARHRPILLAGGLTPDNVGTAIGQVRPWGVDVSSGVETNGAKDSAKIRAFIAAARAADESLGAQ